MPDSSPDSEFEAPMHNHASTNDPNRILVFWPGDYDRDECDEDDDKPAGWYYASTATEYHERLIHDGQNLISLATGRQWDHEMLVRTERGAFAMHSWSQWQGRGGTSWWIKDETAARWMVRNGYTAEAILEATGIDVP